MCGMGDWFSLYSRPVNDRNWTLRSGIFYPSTAAGFSLSCAITTVWGWVGGLWVGEMSGSELQVCQAEKHIGSAVNDWSALPFVTHQTLGLVWRMCTQR